MNNQVTENQNFIKPKKKKIGKKVLFFLITFFVVILISVVISGMYVERERISTFFKNVEKQENFKIAENNEEKNIDINEDDENTQNNLENRIPVQPEFLDKLAQEAEINIKKIQAEQDARQKKEVFTPPEARGSKTVNVFFVKPNNLDLMQVQPTVRVLTSNQTTPYEECDTEYCYTYISLKHAKTFLEKNASNYGISDFKLNIKIDPNIYSLPEVYKLGNFKDVWGKDKFGIVKFEDTFDDLVATQNLDIPKNEQAIFMYLDNFSAEGDVNEFNKTFRSYARPDRGLAYVNIDELEPLYSYFYTEVFIHELLHLYGASDKYVENERKCTENGYGEPERKDEPPQSNSDIMCGYTMDNEGNIGYGNLIQNNLIVNSVTAEEIGWD